MSMRQPDLVRLVRILGMLGSDHAGERASAGLAAHRLVKASGASWYQLLAPAKRAPVSRGGARSFIDMLHDPVKAAESRMRQLRRENEELWNEVRRLRRSLDARHAPERRARASRRAG
jgi:hypothetical protein